MNGKLLLCLSALVLLLTGCYSFGTYQSARLLPHGQMELTGHHDRLDLVSSGDAHPLTDQYGVDLALGGMELNWRARLERVQFRDTGYQHYLAAGPKIGRVDGVLGFNMPVGLLFGENVDEDMLVQFQPTLLATASLDSRVDLTLSGWIL